MLLGNADVEQQIATAIGHALAQMHSNDIVHGDLTTSNMLWRDGTLVCAASGYTA